MKDARISQLAKNLIDYSVNLQKGEKILVETINTSGIPLAKEIIKYVYEKGGIPFYTSQIVEIRKELINGCSIEQLSLMAETDLTRMREMNAYIGIRSSENINEFANSNAEKFQLFQKKYLRPVTDQRVDHTKWCILRYPNASMAQLANMPTDDFEEYYFNVCNMNYSKMSNAMSGLVKLMENTDKVRLASNETDISFSIKGIPAVKCDGHRNIPDGEVYTAPVKNSINGVITYNTPSIYNGYTFENVRLEFKDGKIINATSNNNDKINKLLETDDGAKYVGEFAIGLNPYINFPMKDILFDEKIGGSFHLTPGCCYETANNGNKSAIHWDLVQIQTPEYGGGEIWFDGKLIRKDGLFVIPELECLNPENLK